MRGTANADRIRGDGANNILEGADGTDFLLGSGGNDLLDGGAGFDFVDYQNLGQAVTLLSQGVVEKAGGLGTDILANVEVIFGAAGFANKIDGQVAGVQLTNFNVDLAANSLLVEGIPGLGTAEFNVQNFVDVRGTANGDVIIGNAADNVLEGAAGNDELIGSAGNDVLDGGADTDTVSYATLGQAVTLLSNGGVVKAGGGTDTITNFETIIGATGLANKIDGQVADPDAQFTSFNVDLAANSLEVLDIPGIPGGTASFTVENFVDVRGTANGDIIGGNAANNVLEGADGDDFLIGSGGNDSLDGGAGNDTVSYATLGEAVTLLSQGVVEKAGGLGTDNIENFEVIFGAAGFANKIDGQVVGPQLTSFDVNLATSNLKVLDIPGIPGGTASFTVENFVDVRGTANGDIIGGNAANNVLEGADGDDFLIGSGGNDSLDGGAGNDTVSYATLGEAVTLLSQGVVEKAGGLGTDNIENFEIIIGATGLANKIDGQVSGVQSTIFNVDLANNFLQVLGIPVIGSAEFTVENFVDVRGTANADAIAGNGAANVLEGGAGNDILVGSGGNDTLDGGDGDTDTVDYADLGQAVTLLSQGVVEKAGGLGTDSIANFEVIFGAAGFANKIDGQVAGAQVTSFNVNLAAGFLEIRDIPGLGTASFNVLNFVDVRGTANDDTIAGNGSANVLEGGDGFDRLFGGFGNDILDGGEGNGDILTGGSGADIFLFRSALEGDGDQIDDFSVAQGDRIDLRSFDANVLDPGVQSFTFIDEDPFSDVIGQLRYQGNILEADLDGNGVADFQINLFGASSLSQGDFLL